MDTSSAPDRGKSARTIAGVLTDDANLVNIRTFVVAARYLSFKAAARFLCLTPGAVSHRIANLEDELGFPLFNRLTRGLSLTGEGERLAQICLDAFTRFRDGVQESVGRESFSVLNLYSHQSIALAWLIPRLATFHARHPGVQIHLHTGNALMSFSATSQVDLAVYYAKGAFTGLCSRRFMGEEIFPVCSPAYAAAHGLTDRPEALADCMLLHDAAAWHFASPSAEWQEWSQRSGQNLSPERHSMSFDTSIAAVTAACSGLGVAMGRRNLVRDLLEQGRLVAPLTGLPPVRMGFGYYAVWPRSAQLPPKVELFVHWLHEAGMTGMAGMTGPVESV